MHKISIVQAILMGSIIISLGVYFGLSGQGTTSHSQPVDPQNSTPVESTANEVKQTQDQLIVQVQEALEAVKPALKKSCPVTSNATADHFSISITFDASGQQIARGLSEFRGNTNIGMGACLSRALPPLTIQPTGASTKLDVQFTYP